MSGTNDFKVFANDTPGAANTLTPAAYAALTAIIADGFQEGIADSTQANTVLRQATTAMAVLGYLISLTGANAVDNANIVTLATQLMRGIQKQLPAYEPGDVKLRAVAAVPASGAWFECDGSSLVRASYPELFAAIGTTYGAVDIDHFNIPDMRGMFVRGWDHTRGVDSGRVFGTYQADAMPAHVHAVDLQPLNSADAGGAGKVATGNNSPEGTIPPFNTSSTGVGGETRVKNVAMAFYICVGAGTFTLST